MNTKGNTWLSKYSRNRGVPWSESKPWGWRGTGAGWSWPPRRCASRT